MRSRIWFIWLNQNLAYNNTNEALLMLSKYLKGCESALWVDDIILEHVIAGHVLLYYRGEMSLCTAGECWSGNICFAVCAWNVHACMCTYIIGMVMLPCSYLNVRLNSVSVNAWPTRAHRTAYDNTDCQSEDEQKEEPVAERRRSSLSELGNKLTSLILPLKTLVQPNSYH